MQTIYFYYEKKVPYGCLSNYSAHAVYLKRIIWPTSEHYYQAQKFAGTEREEQVRCQKTPDEAKAMGNGKDYPARPGWHSKLRDEVMLEVIWRKQLDAENESQNSFHNLLETSEIHNLKSQLARLSEYLGSEIQRLTPNATEKELFEIADLLGRWISCGDPGKI